jgi:hypothetical protein
MRSFCGGVLVSTLLLAVPGWTQQATAPSPAPKDPQAVSVLNQALGVAGGAAAIGAITDYTATGTVTYPGDSGTNVSGTITISGRGLNQYRTDEVLPSGPVSLSIDRGFIQAKAADGTVRWVPYAAPTITGSTTLPSLQLAALIVDPNVLLIYKGVVSQGGISVHDIKAFRMFPAQPNPSGPYLDLSNAELFVDTSTLQLVSAQDMIRGGGVRSIQYSNYKTINRVGVPFSVTEQIGSTVTRQVQLNQISFNMGLQDSAFEISQ